MSAEAVGIVVVGAGQAAAEFVASLRMSDYSGRITMIGEEAFPPYFRPPLSKAYLSGSATHEGLYIRPVSAYEKQGIDVRLSCRAVEIDRSARRIVLGDGSSLGYERLVLATGGRARKLQHPGLDAAPNVHYLRTILDIDAMRSGFVPGARLVVIGGGYVGLEVASVARRLGLSVTVLEAQSRVL
ncbi:FAD-dependent oxidoreductase, partial [Variovorax sp. J31P207]|uniref:NAD(P)/FAD-dependent oxidoreductase n=1 Tax=Variovorax sp. J31P207 TaxID=3053510 RepID=UPI002576A3A2